MLDKNVDSNLHSIYTNFHPEIAVKSQIIEQFQTYIRHDKIMVWLNLDYPQAFGIYKKT